jgi:hypothetical protein
LRANSKACPARVLPEIRCLFDTACPIWLLLI